MMNDDVVPSSETLVILYARTLNDFKFMLGAPADMVVAGVVVAVVPEIVGIPGIPGAPGIVGTDVQQQQPETAMAIENSNKAIIA
jgi:hypothetical protein